MWYIDETEFSVPFSLGGLIYFKQFYLDCLSQASYLIGSNGEAVVIDVLRDVDQYLEEAQRQGLKIKYIIETHLHADFVSGHLELAKRCGAEICFGVNAGVEFEHLALKEDDTLEVGDLSLQIMETPGHTPESLCILVTHTADTTQTQKLFTGDTLFIGSVGRPDLVQAKGLTPQDMAASLYDSLREKILPLSDDVEIYPAHGAGSACGVGLSKETWDTLGNQRKTNWG